MTRPTAFHPARLGLAALVGIAYIGGSAWVIRGQGESYRARLREGRPALAGNIAPPPTPTADDSGATGAPPVVTAPDAPPTPIEVRKEAPAPEVARVPEPPAPARPVLDPFWEQPEQKKIWDLDHLTIQDERLLGAALHQMVLKFQKPIEEGPLPRRVAEAAEPFLKGLSRAGLKYTFTVLDSEESSAFSHPGGYVYVNKGVFDWISEDEDYALAFLLTHEIAHVELGHALGCLRDPDVQALKAPTVPLFYSMLIPFGYKEDLDFEADRWAWRRMSQAGRSRREGLAFLRKFGDYAERNGFANVRKAPPQNPRIAPLDHHFRSHPIPRDRLRSLLDSIDPPK